MRLRGRGLRVAALAATGALALAACGSDSGDSGSGSEGASGGKYSIGSQSTDDLTPSNCYDLYCANINVALFEGLFDFETEGTTMKAVPSPLLKSVTTKDDGKTYTIEINPGSTFTNGEKVTAKTFVDTWNYAANGGNAQQLGFVFGPAQLNVKGYDKVSDEKSKDAKMSGLKATSDTTIEMALVAPIGQTLFENYMAGPQILPMPSDAIKDPAGYKKAPIGNGPYKIKGSFSPTSGVTLVRNDDFAFEAGKADEIDYRFYTDDNALWADLQANNLDVSRGLPSTALAQASAVLGDRYINQPAMSFSYEAFPTQVKAFEKREVRVALAKAVNWDEINQKIYYGTRTTATAFAPPTVPGGGQDACGEDCTYDPAKAKELLDSAGGIPGDKVLIGGLANSDNLAPKAQCNFIQESLGIKCEVKIFESFGDQLTAFGKLDSGDEGFILQLGWGADNPTLANMIAPIFGTGSGSNYTGYSSKEFDKLIAEGNQAANEATAVSKWQEAEKVLYKDFAGHGTQWRNEIGGYSTNVSNVELNPGGFINVREITVNSAG